MNLARFTNTFFAAARRRLGHRRFFARRGDWLLSLYDSLLRYAKRIPLPMRGKLQPIHLTELRRPIHVRLGSSDGFVMEEVFITKVYDCVTSAALRDVKLVLDLGANVGLSVRLWREHYPQARIIAVEPDAGNLAVCRMNVAEDGPDSVSIISACAAGRSGWVYLDRSAEECAIAMILAGTDRSSRVRAMTLPEILQQCHAEQTIDLLKCDIEGAEREVFAHCAPWIGRVRYLMIELHPPYTRSDLLADLQRAGWRNKLLWEGITAGNELLFLAADRRNS